jgi:Beta-propeller repeat
MAGRLFRGSSPSSAIRRDVDDPPRGPISSGENTLRRTTWQARLLGRLTGLALLGGWVLGAQTTSPILSTYLGGSGPDVGQAIATDPSGGSYVAGVTSSRDFPTSGGFQPFPTNGFLTRYDALGRVLYSTYLGRTGISEISGVAVGPDGSAFVVGTVNNSRGFLEKISPSGSTLDYDITFGDPYDYTFIFALAVDSAGNAYVEGETSADPYRTWVEKIDPQGSPVWRASLPGSSLTREGGIAVDPAGNIYVTGNTFPPQNTLQDVFVTRLDPSGAVVFTTIFGGLGIDTAQAIALAPDGSVWVGGITRSGDFPTLNPLQAAKNGVQDLFLTRLSPAGTILASTYLGGNSNDFLESLATDSAGFLYLASLTTGATDSPLLDSSQPGCVNELVSKLSPSFQLLGSTCVPGSAVYHLAGVVVNALAVDAGRRVHLTGWTSGDLPVVNAAQPQPGGDADAFLTVLRINRPPDCSAAFASPASLWPPNGKLVPVAIRGVTDLDGDPVAITVTGVRQDEPTGGSPSAFGIGTPDVQLRADRDGKGDGRVYRLSFTAGDPQGASCTGTVTVCVPHDQGRGSTCGDGGGLFGSGG